NDSMSEGDRIDPICGMRVDPENPRGGVAEFEGRRFGFCSPRCRDTFVGDPRAALARGPRGMPATPPVTIALPTRDERDYTRPTRPEGVQGGPGACPICGMALEPRELAIDEPDDPERRDMTRRLVIAAALTLPVVVLAMTGMADTRARIDGWLQATL